jgi:glycosyltransferase involved in cell wall biosynthesis
MKIINLLSKRNDFDFKLMIPKALYQSISDLNTSDSNEFILNSTENTVLIYNYKWKLTNVLEYIIKCVILRLKGYDTLHSIMGIGFSLRLKKLLGFKINYEVVGPVFAEKLKNCDYIYELNKIICVSDSIASQIKSVNDEKVYKKIITYPIPFYNSMAKNFTSNEKENIIVFAHNYMVKRKNAVMCAFLFYELSQLKPDWKFYLLGKGKDGDDRYKNYINFILSGCENVTFKYIDNIYPVLEKSKIFLSLNSINNYPSQSILESMHCKNALVVTDTGQSGRFIKENGELVSVEFNEVKKAIFALMDDDELLDKCENSNRLLKSRFEPSIFINSLVEVYN